MRGRGSTGCRELFRPGRQDQLPLPPPKPEPAGGVHAGAGAGSDAGAGAGAADAGFGRGAALRFGAAFEAGFGAAFFAAFLTVFFAFAFSVFFFLAGAALVFFADFFFDFAFAFFAMINLPISLSPLDLCGPPKLRSGETVNPRRHVQLNPNPKSAQPAIVFKDAPPPATDVPATSADKTPRWPSRSTRPYGRSGLPSPPRFV